jgi:hypothetical protein
MYRCNQHVSVVSLQQTALHPVCSNCIDKTLYLWRQLKDSNSVAVGSSVGQNEQSPIGSPIHRQSTRDKRISTLSLKWGPPLWFSGQSFWLQIQSSGLDSRRYQIFWVVGLEWPPLSLVSITEELLGRKSSGSGLENREYGRRDLLCWPRNILYHQKLVLTSPTSDGRSVGTVRSRTKATKFVLFLSLKMSRSYGVKGVVDRIEEYGKEVMNILGLFFDLEYCGDIFVRIVH